MLGGYWYIEGDDGRHYCYSKEPSYSCPIGSATCLGDLFEQACEHAEIDPAWLLRKLGHNGYRKRVDGKLTENCETCGHKLERLGFRYWIEGPPTEQTAGSRISLRLGGSGFVMVEGPWFAPTKKGAGEWAAMRVEQTKKAVA